MFKKTFPKAIGVLLIIALMLTSFVMPASAAGGLGAIQVEGGQISGVPTDVDSVQVFKGVPFAAPPIGENRWKAPQPVLPWDDVRKCDTWGNAAMQFDTNTPGTFWYDEFYYDDNYKPNTDEDCLYVNVYTPAKSSTDNLPVLVWFHGGGYDHGNASEIEFNASKLAAQGIVVVCAQYRVNIFGFLALDELSAEDPNGSSGNYATLDQIQSLKWVNKNIAAFGGNPKMVTIDGQSAGAMSVRSLLSSPLTKGLYQRAIHQSGFGLFSTAPGGGYTPLADKEVKGRTAVDNAFGAGITLADLRQIPAEDFMEADTYKKFSGLGYGPTLDNYVLTNDSVNLMAKGALDGIDLLIGSNADEYTSLVGKQNGGMYPVDNFNNAMKKTYGTDCETSYGVNLYEKYNFPALYDAANDPAMAAKHNWRVISDNMLELNRVTSSYIMAHNNSNVYTYYFDNPPPGRDSDFYGSYHSAELWYMFNSMRDGSANRDWTAADYALAQTMSTYWANFVKTGNPNGTGLPQWAPTNMDNLSIMRFHNGVAEQMKSQYTGALTARNDLFWDYNLLKLGLKADDLKMPKKPDNTSSTGSTASSASSGTRSNPKTGESANVLGLYGIFLVMAAGVAVFLVMRKTKRES